MGLHAIFDELGRPRAATGNTPLLLTDPATVWGVSQGRVEVFVVEVVAGEPLGPRRHFCTVEEGAALFGTEPPPAGEGRALLAVGVMGTRLSSLELSSLQNRPDLAVDLARLVDGWVAALCDGLVRDIAPRPRVSQLIAPREGADLTDGQLVRAARGVCGSGAGAVRSGSSALMRPLCKTARASSRWVVRPGCRRRATPGWMRSTPSPPSAKSPAGADSESFMPRSSAAMRPTPTVPPRPR